MLGISNFLLNQPLSSSDEVIKMVLPLIFLAASPPIFSLLTTTSDVRNN